MPSHNVKESIKNSARTVRRGSSKRVVKNKPTNPRRARTDKTRVVRGKKKR